MKESLDRENRLAITKIGAEKIGEIEGENEIDTKIERNGHMISICPQPPKEKTNLDIIDGKIIGEEKKGTLTGSRDIMKRQRQCNKKGSQEKFETKNHFTKLAENKVNEI